MLGVGMCLWPAALELESQLPVVSTGDQTQALREQGTLPASATSPARAVCFQSFIRILKINLFTSPCFFETGPTSWPGFHCSPPVSAF